jgi:hypothetical protein
MTSVVELDVWAAHREHGGGHPCLAAGYQETGYSMESNVNGNGTAGK